MKKLAKSIIVAVLNWQVKRLTTKNNFKVIAVAGSVGKTSTKFAIASILSQKLRTRFQEGNYNDVVTVPLIFFGHSSPSLLNPFAWASIFLSNEGQLRKPYPYDVVVVEVGTDYPGNIKEFRKYLKADIGVLTAIAPEHMEFFNDLDAVAEEELTLAEFSKELLINKDMCDEKYTDGLEAQTYGIKKDADYKLSNVQFKEDGYDFEVLKDGKLLFTARHEAIAETQLYSLTAAIAVADKVGLSAQDIEKGIRTIKPVSGRMNRLHGINGSLILDDTYNASPDATIAALNTLYKLKAKQKIALLGNMNELGDFSKAAHEKVGAFCNPKQLAEVITLGPDANEYLAKTAEARGCKVTKFTSPYQVGEYLKDILKPGAVLLAKGSQNGVFAEEAIKQVLADPNDVDKLVRQSDDWLRNKEAAFHE